MLNIQTFDNRSGGNVTYKALAHPLAAEAIAALYASLVPPVALYDPDNIADALLALYPGMPGLEALFVHDVAAVGQRRAGLEARTLTDLPHCGACSVLIAAFDAGRIAARIAHLLPPDAKLHTLDAVKLPDALLTNQARYLDRLNFATNFVFFRDAGGMSTRLVSANYWANYGARTIRLWLRLFDEDGTALATWERGCGVPAWRGLQSTAERCGNGSLCGTSPVSSASTRSVVHAAQHWWWDENQEDESGEAGGAEAEGSNDSDYEYGESEQQEHQGVLDANGRLTISLPTAIDDKHNDQDYRVEARVTDAANREVSGHSTVLAT